MSKFGDQVAKPVLARLWDYLQALPGALFLTLLPLCTALPNEPML